jgi:hypothetical protein
VYFNDYFALFFQGYQILLVGTGNDQLQGFVQHGSDGPGTGGYGDEIEPPPFMGHPYPVLPHRYYANTLDELIQLVNKYINHENLSYPNGIRWFPNGGKTPTWGLGEEAYRVRYELPDPSTYLPLHARGNDGSKVRGDIFRKSIAGWDFVKGSGNPHSLDGGGTALYRHYPQYEVQTGIYEKSELDSELPANGAKTLAQNGQMFTDEDPTGSSGQVWGDLGYTYFIGLPRWSNFSGARYRLISSSHGPLNSGDEVAKDIWVIPDDGNQKEWNIINRPGNFNFYGELTEYFRPNPLGDTNMIKPCVKAYSQVTVNNVEPEWYITPPEEFSVIQRIDENRVSATIYNAKSSPFIREKNNLTGAQTRELKEHEELNGAYKNTNKIGVTYYPNGIEASPFKYPLASGLEDVVPHTGHEAFEKANEVWIQDCIDTGIKARCGNNPNDEDGFGGIDYVIPDIDAPLPPWELTATVERDPGEFIGRENYSGWLWDERTQSLSGPFLNEDVTALATRDNSSEMYCVTSENKIKRTDLLDFNEPNFKPFTDPFTKEELASEIELDEGIILSSKGQGFAYKNRFLPTPFGELTHEQGDVIEPLYFKDSYLSVIETNWIHLGDEHNEKQVYRVDLSFHKNSCGHLWCYIQNDEGLVKGQYKGAIKDHLKVFTNLRGRRFKVKLLVATHNELPWAMREMSIGHLYGKSF